MCNRGAFVPIQACVTLIDIPPRFFKKYLIYTTVRPEGRLFRAAGGSVTIDGCVLTQVWPASCGWQA